MYLGQIIEMAAAAKIFKTPKHPYTKALLAAIPTLSLDRQAPPLLLKGELPGAFEALQGCAFYSRCGEAEGACATTKQDLFTIEGSEQPVGGHEPGPVSAFSHRVACFKAK
jgi:oligopeptide/dipeptide ABC transporter ATP-binding protein